MLFYIRREGPDRKGDDMAAEKAAKGEEVYLMGESLVEVSEEEALAQQGNTLFLVNSRNMRRVLELTHMNFEGEIRLADVGFSKVETQPDCMWGSLYIPKLVDVMGTKYRVLFFINRQHIVIVDDDTFSRRLVQGIRTRRKHQADTKEKFIYNFLSELINRDLMFLANYEKNLMELEEKVVEDRIEDLQEKIVPMRNELMTLQEYYDELCDLGGELEENENGFFDKNLVKYFGVISDRGERLMNKTTQLLEYAKQIKDDYQTNISARQNTNMQFLTIISTIFMPLTLITSWYGMNFENMPELKNGYPFIIVVSIFVIAITFLVFKRKKLL